VKSPKEAQGLTADILKAWGCVLRDTATDSINKLLSYASFLNDRLDGLLNPQNTVNLSDNVKSDLEFYTQLRKELRGPLEHLAFSEGHHVGVLLQVDQYLEEDTASIDAHTFHMCACREVMLMWEMRSQSDIELPNWQQRLCKSCHFIRMDLVHCDSRNRCTLCDECRAKISPE